MAEDFIPDTSPDFIPDTPEKYSATNLPPGLKAPPPNMSGMPLLDSQWAATRYGVGQALGGAWDVVKGLGQSLQPPKSTTEKVVTALSGPPGLIAKRMLESGASSLSGITQVPGAIRDLMNAPDAVSQLAAVAPRAGGQGAAALALAKGPEILDSIPSFGKAKANFKVAQAANQVPLDVSKVGDAAFNVQDLAQSGGQMPKVVRDFLKRVTEPGKAPVDYAQGRKFYSNASRLSSNEFQKLTPAMQREVAAFTRELGNSIQDAANKAGVGPEHATAMNEYHRASQFSKSIQKTRSTLAESALKGAGAGVGGAIGGYVFSKLAGRK